VTITAFTDSHITLDTIYTSDHDGQDAALELLDALEVEGTPPAYLVATSHGRTLWRQSAQALRKAGTPCPRRSMVLRCNRDKE